MSVVVEEEIKRWTARRKSALVCEIIHDKTTVSEASRQFDLVASAPRGSIGLVMKFICRLILIALSVELLAATPLMAGNNSSNLERALSAATGVARSCRLDVDLAEVSIAILGSDYRIRFQQPHVRGGGAIVVVERLTSAVKSFECLQ